MRSGPSSEFSFYFRRCNHFLPRGYRCKDCDLVGGKSRHKAKPGGGCCSEVKRAIRRTWIDGAVKPCPGNGARLSQASWKIYFAPTTPIIIKCQ